MLKRGIISCCACIRNNFTLNSLLAFLRLTCIINVVSLWPHAAAQCSDVGIMKSEAISCFRKYSTHKLNVARSDKRLFSGIDIEILRQYCSSYMDAMRCVSRLVTSCPASSQREIEEALVNYNGIQEELTDLCTTHRLFELYSQFMTCYSNKGETSDWCYDSKLNSTIHNIYQPPTEEFCSLVREATVCIESNILKWCGEQAKELVHLLVKPTVSGSAKCKYSILQENTPQTMKTVDNNIGTNHPKERATSSQSHSNNSSSSATTHSLHVILILVTFYLSTIAHLLKPKGAS